MKQLHNEENPVSLRFNAFLCLSAERIYCTNPQADTSKLEGAIDQLVYQLYGLTEDEIKIVEGKS